MEIYGFQEAAGNTFITLYQSVINTIPPQYKIFIDLLILSLIIILYSIFMWEACKFTGKRDILELNLEQYKSRSKRGFKKFSSSLLFLLEYIVILPSVIFFWFLVLSSSLLLMAEFENVIQILLFAAALIVATRIAAYYSEDLSDVLAQLFPFTLLFYFLINPVFIEMEELIRRFIEIPSVIQHMFVYMIFIFFVEILLRTFFTISQISKEEKENEEEPKVPRIRKNK